MENTLIINSVRKVLLKRLINKLFPEYEIVHLKRNGMVHLKEKRWKFWNVTKIHSFQLCMVNIPEKLASNRKELKGMTETLSELLYPKIYGQNENIIDYLWKKYQDVFLATNQIKLDIKAMSLDANWSETANSYAILPIRQRDNIGNVLRLLRRKNNKKKIIQRKQFFTNIRKKIESHKEELFSSFILNTRLRRFNYQH